MKYLQKMLGKLIQNWHKTINFSWFFPEKAYMKKLFVLSISLNLVLFFNFSLWGSYGPLRVLSSVAYAEGDEGEVEVQELPTETAFVDPQLGVNNNFPLNRRGNAEIDMQKEPEHNCVASGPREFEQTVIFASANK